MNEIELKSLLHECIENIHDLDFLEEVRNLIQAKQIEVSDTKVPAYILDILNQSKKEIGEGKFKPNEQVEKETDQWLSE